jgi:hypothetical protein
MRKGLDVPPVNIGALVAMVLFVGFGPSGVGRASGLELLGLPWIVHVGLVCAISLYVLGLVASLRRRVRESL